MSKTKIGEEQMSDEFRATSAYGTNPHATANMYLCFAVIFNRIA